MPYLPEAKTEALRVLPGIPELLDAVADRPGTYLVGGAVRDLMLGFAQFDYDVLVEGDAGELAEHLAQRIGGTVTLHPRFLTANFRSTDGALSIDVASARTETYAEPGALPQVEPADLERDLVRRDFTVNAMALAVWQERFGELFEFPDASADLLARVLRVTHDQSFIDDPTRLLRLLRYGARLGFTAEPHTEELARRAVAAGAPGTVSGGRIRDELLDLLAERSAVVGVESMYALGLDRALHEKFDADEYVVARATNEQVDGLRQELLLLALCSRAMEPETLNAWLAHLKLSRRDAEIVIQAVARGAGLITELARAQSNSEVDSLLRSLNTETIVFALALPGGDRETAEVARRWLKDRNEGKLEISGADLRDAGVSEGPVIGRALAETLEATLNGALAGRDAQLTFALDQARGEG
ncbi:MAG: CCA tRNA nucleotidyltransferase [Thermoleophilaceae bacterium]|nr:CCA tRNA nucleotidyltransferase [Thermoleophilaceae bacterium]